MSGAVYDAAVAVVAAMAVASLASSVSTASVPRASLSSIPSLSLMSPMPPAPSGAQTAVAAQERGTREARVPTSSSVQAVEPLQAALPVRPDQRLSVDQIRSLPDAVSDDRSDLPGHVAQPLDQGRLVARTIPLHRAMPSRWRLAEVATTPAAAAATGAAPREPAAPRYPWWPPGRVAAAGDTLAARIPPPPGFERVPAAEGSWAAWLRALPLKPDGAPVTTFDGAPKARQDVHAAVVDMDVGNADLQQCADAVMRLRAEWLWSVGRQRDIAFSYTGGGRVPFSRWATGNRPSDTGKEWRGGAKSDSSYAGLRRYLRHVMTYAGTYSLDHELQPADIGALAAGDVFIKGGFPGHAVLVADVARNVATGEKRFLLVQSYMPAQDIHVLRNPADETGSPWYALPTGRLATPEWTFEAGSLKRWP